MHDTIEPLPKIYTNEVPFGHFSPAELRDLVVHQDLRPDRPNNDEAPQLTEELWQLIEHCWVGDPHGRPTVDFICDRVLSIMNNSQILQPDFPTTNLRATNPDCQHIYDGGDGGDRQVPSNDFLDDRMSSSLAPSLPLPSTVPSSEKPPAYTLRYSIDPDISTASQDARSSNSGSTPRPVDIDSNIIGSPSESIQGDQIGDGGSILQRRNAISRRNSLGDLNLEMNEQELRITSNFQSNDLAALPVPESPTTEMRAPSQPSAYAPCISSTCSP